MNAHASAEFRLLNEFQHDFPLHPTPYALIGEHLGMTEHDVIAGLQQHQHNGTVSRVGAVFPPNRIGASALAALRVPPAQLDAVAAQVSALAAVNHNYAREHEWNLWFVVAAPDLASRDAALTQIAADTGMPLITLPLRDEFHIDLGFDLTGGRKRLACAGSCTTRELSATEQALVRALEGGLPFVPQPFAAIGSRIGMSEAAVLAQLMGWRSEGLLKRFGVVVRHHELGYTANAMCVWDVPDEVVTQYGCALAGLPGVTLCYRRERDLPHWPYNLYCMIHGKSREEVIARHAEVAAATGLAAFPGDRLISVKRYKQCGARYAQEQAA